MATPKKNDAKRFKGALELLYAAEERASRTGMPQAAWVGAREGISGTTLEALARRGLAIAIWTDKPYRRIVGRIKQPGIALVREWKASA